jgi:hypothetical protein
MTVHPNNIISRIQQRNSKIEELYDDGHLDIFDHAQLKQMVMRRDVERENLYSENSDLRESLEKAKDKVAYLVVLLSAIDDNDTTKAQWEELLMLLALTTPDRLELVNEIKKLSINNLLTYIDDNDLK